MCQRIDSTLLNLALSESKDNQNLKSSTEAHKTPHFIYSPYKSQSFVSQN